MSLVVGEPTRQCPRCRLKMRRFYTSLPSGGMSPWCRACTIRSMSSRSLDLTLPPGVALPRATLHDEQARPELRRFAFVMLWDFHAATEEDQRVFRTLLPPDGPSAMPTGGHGAAKKGPRVPELALDAQTDRERGRRPDGEPGEEEEEPT